MDSARNVNSHAFPHEKLLAVDAGLQLCSRTNHHVPMKTLTHPTRREFQLPDAVRWQHRFEQYRDDYQMKREDLTRLSGFAPRTLAAWAAGETPSASSARKLVEIDRFLQALAEIIEPSAMGPWLRTSNPAFEGSTPIQLFERGECDRLWRMIHDLNSGQPA